ncbi:hypothetical protein JST99_02105 [Candidatus Dependentiae bacterium]|nr:hypothetical protein [Candidatus Dependentiae bacterium]
MKKKSIAMLLVVCSMYGAGDIKKKRAPKTTSSLTNVLYPLPYPEPSQQQELAQLNSKAAADPHQLKKEVCVGICCYTCVSTAVIITYHASTYLLGTLKNAALRHLNIPTN